MDSERRRNVAKSGRAIGQAARNLQETKTRLVDVLNAVTQIQRHVHAIMAEALEEYKEEMLDNETIAEEYAAALEKLRRAGLA